jgi:hypothetical protein
MNQFWLEYFRPKLQLPSHLLSEIKSFN